MKNKQKHQHNKTPKRPVIATALISLIASALCLAVVVFALTSMGFFGMLKGLTIPEGSIRHGAISEEGEITSIPKGEIRYRVNSDVVFENPYCRGNIVIENPRVSEYDLVFVFRLNDRDNTEIYRSKKLKPGEYIKDDKLTEHGVGKGTYRCELMVEAYEKNGEYMGSTTSKVNVIINHN